MDEIDHATERAEAFNRVALSAVINRPRQRGDGTCKNCRDPIESDRLKVNPLALHCAECASALEEDRARQQRRGW